MEIIIHQKVFNQNIHLESIQMNYIIKKIMKYIFIA